MQTSDYPCPRRSCRAQPGEPCVDRAGRERAQLHAGRAKQDPVVQIQLLQQAKKERAWWLTVGRGGECKNCAADLAGQPTVYRHSTKTAVCRACADYFGWRYEVSGTWMRHVAAEREAA